MTSTEAATEPQIRRSPLANLARIMVRPRETIRLILDGGRDRMLIPIVLLATISSFIGDIDVSELEFIRTRGLVGVLITIGVVIGITALFLGLFYLYAWVAYWIGRAFEGKGTPREVRSAAAWGSVPIAWMLIYRIPLLIFLPSATTRVQFGNNAIGKDGWSFTAGEFGTTCALALIIAVVEFGFLIWFGIVSSNTIAEAHRFETWRGFVTLLFTAASPAIITIAAVLAM